MRSKKYLFFLQHFVYVIFFSSIFYGCEKGVWDLKRLNPNDINNNSTNPSKDSLATIFTENITNITTVSAISGGNITNDGGAAVTSRGICWSLNPNPTILNSKSSDGNGTGKFTSNLSNLSPNTKYYVKAFATNTYGTSYGNEINFTTSSSSITISNDLNKIQFIDNSIGYACGNGIIVKTTNGGTSWTSIRESNAINFTSINFTTELNGYAGGNDQYYSYVFRTTNGGLTWQEIGKFWFSNERSKVTSIFASVDGSRIVALVNQYPNASQVYGHMYYSSNSGATWLSTGVDRAAGFNAGDYYNNRIFIGGHQYWTGTTYRTNVYENTFIGNGATVFTTNLVDNSINFNDIDIVSSYGFGVSDNGQLAITTDNAKNWSVRTIPGYATINFTSVKFIDNNTGYISTEDGKVLKTDNSGLAWNLIYTATKNIHNLALRPDGKVYAVGQTGLLTAIN